MPCPNFFGGDIVVLPDFLKNVFAVCLAVLVLCFPIGCGLRSTSVSAYSVSEREFVSQSENFSSYVPGTYSEETINGFLRRCYNVAASDASDYFLEVYSDSGCRVYFFDKNRYVAEYDEESECYIITGLSIKGNNYNWSWSGNAGISNNSTAALLYYPDKNCFMPVSTAEGVSYSGGNTEYFWRSSVDFSLNALKGVGSFNAEITETTDETFTVRYSNNSDVSVQYLTWVSPASAQNGAITRSYNDYVWCYQTKQNCLLYRQSFLSDVLDDLNASTDIFGQVFNPTNCIRIPLAFLLKSVPADSKLLGCYSKETMYCPYQFLSASNSKTVTYKYSDINLGDSSYFLHVAYRDTVTTEVAAHHRATYAYVYFDTSDFLDDNYTVALNAAVTKPDDYEYSPVTVDKDGNPITDGDGNPIYFATDYTDDIYNMRSTISGSASATGGSASVVNAPVFNNDFTITIGDSGSGSGSDSDGDGDGDGSSGSGSGSGFSGFGDLKGFSNALDSSKNFLSVLQSYEGLIPSSCTVLLGAGVVAIIICRFIGR